MSPGAKNQNLNGSKMYFRPWVLDPEIRHQWPQGVRIQSGKWRFRLVLLVAIPIFDGPSTQARPSTQKGLKPATIVNSVQYTILILLPLKSLYIQPFYGLKFKTESKIEHFTIFSNYHEHENHSIFYPLQVKLLKFFLTGLTFAKCTTPVLTFQVLIFFLWFWNRGKD